MSENRIDLSKFKVSSVGTNVDSPDSELEVELKYSGIAWFFVTWFGTTRMPYEIIFKCKKSQEVFETLTDEKLIEHYMTFRRT